MSGNSSIKYWFENDIEIGEEELPVPYERPVSYLKTPLCWAFYYLKHNYSFNEALKDMIKRGGDTSANAAIVGGLIGASCGVKKIDQNQVNAVLALPEQSEDVESAFFQRPQEYQPCSVISIGNNDCMIYEIIKNAPRNLNVVWENQTFHGAQEIYNKFN